MPAQHNAVGLWFIICRFQRNISFLCYLLKQKERHPRFCIYMYNIFVNRSQMWCTHVECLRQCAPNICIHLYTYTHLLYIVYTYTHWNRTSPPKSKVFKYKPKHTRAQAQSERSKKKAYKRTFGSDSTERKRDSCVIYVLIRKNGKTK